MNDYSLLQLSDEKRLDAYRERATDRLAALVRCCQPSRFMRWLTNLRPNQASTTCAASCCA